MGRKESNQTNKTFLKFEPSHENLVLFTSVTRSPDKIRMCNSKLFCLTGPLIGSQPRLRFQDKFHNILIGWPKFRPPDKG